MSDNDFLLHELQQADGWISQEEILWRSHMQRGHGLTVHSRAADLRKKGHVVENKCEHRNGRAVSFYRLVGEKSAAPISAGVSLVSGSTKPNESEERVGALEERPGVDGHGLSSSASIPATPQVPTADRGGALEPLFVCDIDESAGLRGAYGDG